MVKIIIAILGLIYLVSCVVILYHTIQSFDVKYENNKELQEEFVRKMKKHFTFNISLLILILTIIFIKVSQT